MLMRTACAMSIIGAGNTHRIVQVSKRRAQHVEGRVSVIEGRQRQLSRRRLLLLLLLFLLQLWQGQPMLLLLLLVLQRLLLLVLLLLQDWHAPHVLLQMLLL